MQKPSVVMSEEQRSMDVSSDEDAASFAGSSQKTSIGDDLHAIPTQSAVSGDIDAVDSTDNKDDVDVSTIDDPNVLVSQWLSIYAHTNPNSGVLVNQRLSLCAHTNPNCSILVSQQLSLCAHTSHN